MLGSGWARESLRMESGVWEWADDGKERVDLGMK
jgi:hypothetical protein